MSACLEPHSPRPIKLNTGLHALDHVGGPRYNLPVDDTAAALHAMEATNVGARVGANPPRLFPPLRGARGDAAARADELWVVNQPARA